MIAAAEPEFIAESRVASASATPDDALKQSARKGIGVLEQLALRDRGLMDNFHWQGEMKRLLAIIKSVQPYHRQTLLMVAPSERHRR